MNPANTAKVLNSLIQTLKDGQEGFRLAAEGAKSVELKRVFHEFSLQRAKLAGELQMFVRELGEEYENSSSVLGTLHRGWINVRTAVTSQDDQAILDECERGEDTAVSHYRDALAEDLPANIRTVITNQASDIKDAHDKVKALRDQGGSASTPIAA
ncbi:MAG: PA2169 family four-helix-bundle protein [Verrucomicrobia bacterium]|nr:PA2169 family four-helix-bundle protein [Verrucomicrobiota bacterium]